MILNALETKYNETFHKILWKARDYVRENYSKLKSLPVGKHQLPEIAEGAFVNVNEYDTKDNPPWESHFKYVDIQVVFEGCEDFEIANVQNLTKKGDYNAETDYQDWDGESSIRLTLFEGDMLILLPEDAHRVGFHPKGKKTHVKKCIVKVPYIK